MEDYLGYVTWHSMSATDLFSLEELKPFKEKFNPMIKLPKKPSKASLFKRTANRVNIVEEDFKIKCKNITNRSATIVRNNFSIGKVSRIKGNLDFEAYSQDCKHFGFAREIFEYAWEYEANCVDHMALRNIIKSALEDTLGAVWLSSGTYFVPRKHQAQLEALQDVVGNLCEMRVIPLVESVDPDILQSAYDDKMMKIRLTEFNELLLKLQIKATVVNVKKAEALVERVEQLEKDSLDVGIFNKTNSKHMRQQLRGVLNDN